MGSAESSAEGEQGLAEAISRLVLGEMTPEKSGEHIAGMGSATGQGKVGKQRLGVPGPQAEDGTRAKASLEAAEQGETQPPHGFVRAAKHRITSRRVKANGLHWASAQTDLQRPSDKRRERAEGHVASERSARAPDLRRPIA
jgi:hypothetical protein